MAQQLDAREEQLQQKAAEIARYATVKQRLEELEMEDDKRRAYIVQLEVKVLLQLG